MKASIIIPVYNAQKTLGYCLDSVLNQTYQDFEIILVNDGSKDKSQEIIEKYKRKYPSKIKSYKQQNSGIAIARNNGIKYSLGTYLFFIDNDDYIEKDYLQTFISAIEKEKADVVIGGYERIDIANKRVILRKDPIDDISTKYAFLAPWGRVYKKEALVKHNIKFLDFSVGEDIYLNILVNLKLKVQIISYNGYRWVFNKSSLSNTKQRCLEKKERFLPLLVKIYNDTKDIKKDKEEKALLEYFFLKTCIFYLLHSGRNTEYKELKKARDEAFKWILKTFPTYRKNIHISLLKPKGERFSTRAVVCIFIFLQKLHLDTMFLWIYSKF